MDCSTDRDGEGAFAGLSSAGLETTRSCRNDAASTGAEAVQGTYTVVAKSSQRSRDLLRSVSMGEPVKNIVICCDGTGNDYARTPSNVWRMRELLHTGLGEQHSYGQQRADRRLAGVDAG